MKQPIPPKPQPTPSSQARPLSPPPAPDAVAPNEALDDAPRVVEALAVTRLKKGWAVILYKIQGREILDAEILGEDGPVLSKDRVDNLIRVETMRRFIMQVDDAPTGQTT